ncbi:RTA1 like protein [Byssothecium circinans]|uniref:RTA1 like protein n=1 Tax=Byssothecium circinans TaxID=147558 RepID=A0A6A5TCU9_9PLEO|nr:RTA1 like protein [Byssothecium circinans]
MESDSKPEYKLWLYKPSIAGGVIGAIVFFILTGAHAFRLVKNRTWFCIPFIIGGLFEGIGYAARAAAHSDIQNKIPYIIQSILILVAPILFAASIYMTLGRLIQRTDSASLSLIRATWVTKIFVTGDILCFFIQAGGAGKLVQGKDSDSVKMGENIILGGLILQILIFGFFVVVAGTWHRRLDARPTARAAEVPWLKYVRLLYAASAFITIRNACRVVEYALGRVRFLPWRYRRETSLTGKQDGFLLQHEWTLYVYDFVPMVLALAVCLTWYDPNLKPRNKGDVEIGGIR